MTSRISRCDSQAVAIMPMRLAPTPGTSASRPTSLSMMSSVRLPKRATMRSAMTGPSPLIIPEPRYFTIPWIVPGTLVVNCSTLNWSPKRGWLVHSPTISSTSPGVGASSVPTTVTGS